MLGRDEEPWDACDASERCSGGKREHTQEKESVSDHEGGGVRGGAEGGLRAMVLRPKNPPSTRSKTYPLRWNGNNRRLARLCGWRLPETVQHAWVRARV